MEVEFGKTTGVYTLELSMNPSNYDTSALGLCGRVGTKTLYSSEMQDLTNDEIGFVTSWKYAFTFSSTFVCNNTVYRLYNVFFKCISLMTIEIFKSTGVESYILNESKKKSFFTIMRYSNTVGFIRFGYP